LLWIYLNQLDLLPKLSLYAELREGTGNREQGAGGRGQGAGGRGQGAEKSVV